MKGLLVVVIGVDGSGKSSLIKNLAQKSEEFGRPIKIIYFGYNNFIIPGLSKLNLKYKDKKSSYIGAMVKFIALIDVKLRAIPAFYYRQRGYLVLGDRFYYDQQIGDPIGNFSNSKLLKIIFNPFIRWLPISPDLLLYLQVSADTAYSRKPEFSKKKFSQTVSEYEVIMKTNRAFFIDAEKKERSVLNEVVSQINNRLR